MIYKSAEDFLIKRKFREEVKGREDKDLYLEAKTISNFPNGIGKLELIVLEKRCASGLSIEEISLLLEKPLEKIETYYKNGMRKTKIILFEDTTEYLLNKVKEDTKEEEQLNLIKYERWKKYLNEMNKKSDLEIYNLVTRETIIRGKLFTKKICLYWTT